jgi:hypothetical protein
MTLMKRSCIFSALVDNQSVDVLLLVFTTAVIGGGCLMIMIMMMSQRQRQRPASPSTSLPQNNRRSRWWEIDHYFTCHAVIITSETFIVDHACVWLYLIHGLPPYHHGECRRRVMVDWWKC